jgi:tape measure domain-containing protein
MTTAQPAGGGALGFGLQFTLQNAFSAPAAEIQKSFQSLSNTTDRLSGRISDSLNRLQSGFMNVGGAVAMMFPIKSAIDAFGEFDSLQRGMLAVMGNNIGAVRSEMIKLREVAKLPAMGIQEVVRASTGLMSVGMSADLARNAILGFGGAIAQIGGGRVELDGVMLQIRQMMSVGKVLGADLRPVMSRIPQLGAIMLKTFGTASAEGISKLGISAKEFVERISTELLKLPKMTGGLKNGLENISDNIFLLKAKLGELLAPTVERLTEKFSKLIDQFQEFASNPIGSFVVKTTASLLTLGAGFLLFREAKSIFIDLSGVASSAFAAIRKGVTTMLYAMTLTSGGLSNLQTAITGFVTGNIAVIAFAAIAGAVYLAYKAWQSFDSFLSGSTQKMSSWGGFLQKVGGYLHAIGEMFSTLTPQGWRMTESLSVALEKLGIYDNVVALGMWLTRVYNLAIGFGEALSKTWSVLKSAAKWVIEGLDSIGLHLNGNLGALASWQEAGRLLGVVFVTALAAVTASFIATGIAAGIAWLSATWPILAIGAALAALVYGIHWLWKNWSSIIDAIKTKLSAWADAAWSVGSNFIMNLWDGIKAQWTSFTNWITEKWNSIASIFGGGSEVDYSANVNTNYTSTGSKQLEDLSFYRNQVASAPFVAAAATAGAANRVADHTANPVVVNPTPVQNNIYLDSRAIIHRSNKINGDDAALSN